MTRFRWWLMKRFFKAEGQALYQRGRDEQYIHEFLRAMDEAEQDTPEWPWDDSSAALLDD